MPFRLLVDIPMNLRKFPKFKPATLGTVFGVLTCICAAIYVAAMETRERYGSVLAGEALAVSATIDARLEQTVGAVQSFSLDHALDDLDGLGPVGPRAKTLTDATGGRVVILTAGATSRAVFDSQYPYGLPWHVSNGYSSEKPIYSILQDVLITKKYVISDLRHSPKLGELVVFVMVPIVRHGQITGTIALILPSDALANILRSTDLPDHQSATVIDGGNRVVNRSRGRNGDRVGWPIPRWMAEVIAEKTHGVMSGIGVSGVDNMMAFQQLSIAPQWRVIVSEPNDLVNRFLWQPFLWIAVGGVFALIAFAWWILAWRQRFFRDTDILRTQQTQLARLHRTMPAIEFLLDVRPDGEFSISYASGDFLRVTGRPFEELSSMALWERFRAPDTLPLRDVIKAALKDGSISHEFRFNQPDGSWRWLRSEVTRLHMNADGSGEVVGYIVNVDETRKAEQHAASSVNLSAVGKITASLASELRRPLSAAHIAIEILEQELENGDTKLAASRAKLIKGKIESVIHAHDQLRRFSAKRGYAASLKATSIDDAVAHVLDVIAPILREDDIDIWVNIPPLGCPHVIANPVDLEQVVMSLLLNARDAILAKGPGAGRRISIQAIPNPGAEVVAIKIADNGGGIPGEVQSHLFEPFVTTKQDAGNTGLDLAICNSLMLRMNGAIDARNDDSGAIFTIVLPAAAPITDEGLAQRH